MTVMNPMKRDISNVGGIYSLPMLLDQAGAGKIILAARLPMAAVALMSLTPLILPERGQRIRAAICTASLCILAHNLSYFQGWEYSYTALLPLLPAMLWLWQHESVPWLRRILMGCFFASLPLFLPAPFFFAQEVARDGGHFPHFLRVTR